MCGMSSSYEMRKMRRYTEWSAAPYKEKRLYEEFNFITQMCAKGNLTGIITNMAITYHARISEYNQSYRVPHKQGLIAAAVYIACRRVGWPRTHSEIAGIFGLDVSVVTQGCKTAQEIIDRIETAPAKEVAASHVHTCSRFEKQQPVQFVERFANACGMTEPYIKLCQFIATKVARDNLMPENTPHSIAASIIYFVAISCKLPGVSKEGVHRVSDISLVTISKCQKKFETMNLIPSRFLEGGAHV